MNELSVFNFDNNKITAVIYDGKPAFVAMDVARALGYQRPADALAQHCKSLIKLKYGEMQCLGFEPKPQGVTLIREADVYRLVMRSKLESAERFQDWVVEEVLPALRENGHYGCKPALPDFGNPAAAARAWADEYEQKLLAQKEAERLALENKEMAPKADVYDRIIDRNNLYNATQVAQKFGQSAIWLNRQLEQFGVYNRAVKRGRVFQQWFIDKGYGIMRETETGHSQAMFYAEGEMWIIGKLTQEGLI